ncbi:TPA: hypothetical protein N2965_004560 [Vibrio parahaemolyticus]|nr:hypothetical protein [Vibrio parahaemolyticus]
MSTEQLMELTENGFTLSNFNLFIILIISVFGGFVGSFLSSYAKEKGKNFATKEDIDELYIQTEKLTHTTEFVKLKVAENSRIDSKAWEIKLKIHLDILESLATWRTLIKAMISDLYNSDGTLKDSLKAETVENRQIRMSSIFENIAKIEAISELVLSNEQISKIRSLRSDVNQGVKSVDDVKESFELAIENIKNLEAEIGAQAKSELFEKHS